MSRGILTIELSAIVKNWQRLKSFLLPTCDCAAVVKANAYGLGAIKVVEVLIAAGCRHFFVATLEEAMDIKPITTENVRIYILNGIDKKLGKLCMQHNFIPVLNSVQQVDIWQKLARNANKKCPAVLQVDTGMSRLGVSLEECAHLANTHLPEIEFVYLLSHLAASEIALDPANQTQLKRFHQAKNHWPHLPASLANSSGIFLGGDFHFQLVRAGAALYGLSPRPGESMLPVVRLQGKVLQIRDVPAGASAGYNHTWIAPRPSRLLTIGVGYADGYPRSLSNKAVVHWQDEELPIAGNVSMDTIIMDATTLQSEIREGDWLDLLGPHQDVDQLAKRAGTIGYEILTRLGTRYERIYQP